MRVRADEIRPGDHYVYRQGRGARGVTTVVTVPRLREKSLGGARLTRVVIVTLGLLVIKAAPHSRHDIIRPAEPQTDLPIPERAKYWVAQALNSQRD
jgi:hypothetical protein